MEVLSFFDAVQRDMADNIYNFCKDGKSVSNVGIVAVTCFL